MFAITSVDFNVLLSMLFVAGMVQVSWLAVQLRRKGVAPKVIWLSSQPMFVIWVVMWPAYDKPQWIIVGLLIFAVWLLWALLAKSSFWLHLRQAWSAPGKHEELFLWPPLALWLSLLLAFWLFQNIPEFGLGVALCATLIFPCADLLDRTTWMKLQFPLHPEQTLIGHLALIVLVSLLCSWSVHLYHGMNWQQLWMATGLAGVAASWVRALLPRWLNQPLALVAIATMLWVL